MPKKSQINEYSVLSFLTLQLRNITIAFLPPNVASLVQHLDQGIIASFKVRYKKKLLEWVLF